ncbi:MAG: hypothetical protein AAGD25_04980 [Cyanobacteria bacterium P01_F01_bin.150]
MYLFDTTASYPTRPDTLEQRDLYTYIRDLAHLDDDNAIERFYRLLWNGNAHPNETVANALKAVVMAPDFEQQSLNIINRCYYTLTNLWHMKTDRGEALTRLILWLEDMPANRAQNRVIRKLRTAIQTYQQDERYAVLKRHLRLIDNPYGTDEYAENESPQERYFGDLFQDYFFLYEAGTQTPDISNTATHLNQGILYKRNQRLKQFGQELNQFYVRSQHIDVATNINPTHLSDQDLLGAINLYRPKRSNSFKNQAEYFQASTRHVRSAGEFKQILLDHVVQPVSNVGPRCQRRFEQLFQVAMADFQTNVPLTQVVRIQMFSRLINTLVSDGSNAGNSFYYLLEAVGSNLVTSLLINIVLSCKRVRFELEKRFAYLYHQFFNTENEQLQWLMAAFDHMNVALALNAKYLGYFNLNPAYASMIPDSV